MSQQTPPRGAVREYEPYCSECGYVLTGATDSSKCPECGRPIVEVLTRAPRTSQQGKRYRSEAELWGWPIIDVAFGPKHDEVRGRARGIIALGDDAMGGIAVGGQARGIVAVGGGALGVCSFGGGSVGLLTSFGGFSMGGIAVGGGAIGGIAAGGGAIGFVAQGGGAIGYYARGGGPIGKHIAYLNGGGSPEALAMFSRLDFMLGGNVVNAGMIGRPAAFVGLVMVIVALGVLAAAWWGNRAWRRRQSRETPFSP